MKKSNGLADFCRKERQRMASKGKAAPDLVHYYDNWIRKPGMAPEKPKAVERKPYMLAPNIAARTAGFASKDCWRCKGTGVSGWRNGGFAAVVCACVKHELKRREEVYAELSAKLKANMVADGMKIVEDKKAKGEVAPHRPCLSCQRLEGTDADTQVLVSTKDTCDVCNGTKTIPLTDVEWATHEFLAAEEQRRANSASSEPAGVPTEEVPAVEPVGG